MSNSKKKRKAAKARLKPEQRLREHRNERSAPTDASFIRPDIHREIRYITERAQDEDSRLVSLGKLVLFSTRTRDAWPLAVEFKSATATIPRWDLTAKRTADRITNRPLCFFRK
jgi:hypothetical protein